MGTTQRFTVGSEPRRVNIGEYEITVPPRFGYEVRTVPEGVIVLVYMPGSEALVLDASISAQPRSPSAEYRSVTLNGIKGRERRWQDGDETSNRELYLDFEEPGIGGRTPAVAAQGVLGYRHLRAAQKVVADDIIASVRLVPRTD